MKNDTATVAAIGIDLGDKTSCYACLSEQGELMEEASVAMTPAAFRKAFAVFPPTRIAIEAGAQSRWVAVVLEDLKHEVIVSNPRQVQLISANDSKNDANDAKLLARLARVDPSLLSPLQHRAEPEHIHLLAIRARAQLVDTRTALMSSLRGMVKAFGIRLPDSASDCFVERCRSCVPQALADGLDGMFQTVGELTRQIETYDQQIEQMAHAYPEVARFTAIAGVGTLTALTYVLTLGDAKRFAHSRDVGAYLGLRPRQQQSGGQDPQLGITKAGDGYLRKLLVQCAHCILRKYGPDTALRRWGLSLCTRGAAPAKGRGDRKAKKRAVVAVARKLAVLLHHLWVCGEDYKPFPATH